MYVSSPVPGSTWRFSGAMMRPIKLPFTTIVDVDTLAEYYTHPTWIVVDCRFDLVEKTLGRRQYEVAHIPGAVYADLEKDLSIPIGSAGEGGRHPLPTPEQMKAVFGRLGIDKSIQVIAYDDTSGHYAARLWWMLRFMGHEAVAVLDGGWPAWLGAGLPVRSGVETNKPRFFEGEPRWDRIVVLEDVLNSPLLVDGRAPERYRGEVEPIDPVPGHIPGAVNRPYSANWTEHGLWRSQEDLLADYLALLGDVSAEEATFYCGSGVSACVNLVGMMRAGLPEGRLYVGSWSEWSRLIEQHV